MRKKTVKHNSPLVLGCVVYSYSKLVMLKFIYEFLFYYFDKSDICLLNSDTDSIWIAVSNENFEELIKPNLRREYFENFHKTWPSQSCEIHRNEFVETRVRNGKWDMSDKPCCLAYNKKEERTPLLFKFEYISDFLYALNSKTYHSGCFDTNIPPKVSTKGISKRHSKLLAADFNEVLESKKSKKGTNISFKSSDSNVYTYKQEKIGLSYLYCKRIVCEDGFTTLPTNM